MAEEVTDEINTISVKIQKVADQINKAAGDKPNPNYIKKSDFILHDMIH